MCLPTFSRPSGSGLVMQVEERRPRYPGEPRNRRLKFVSERERSSDEWNLVRASRGSRRSGMESEHGHDPHQPVGPLIQHPENFGHGQFGQPQPVWPQWHQHQQAHHPPPHHQGQMGFQQHPQIHPPPHNHHPHHEIQVMHSEDGFIDEENGHHQQQYRLVERVPMPHNMQVHHRGGGRARSLSRDHHGHHDRHRDPSSSDDEERYRSGRRRGVRTVSIEDDDSFDDLRPRVRRWRRRSSSHRSTSRRRR